MLVTLLGDPPSTTSSDVRSPTRTSSDVRSPTRTSTEVRSPTSTSTEVRSPTSTSTEVRSPTSTSTDAYTSGNITVTGGAGDGAYTTVTVYQLPRKQSRVDADQYATRSKGVRERMKDMIKGSATPRAPSPMPAIMASTSAPRPVPVTSTMNGAGAAWSPLQLLLGAAGAVGLAAAGYYGYRHVRR